MFSAVSIDIDWNAIKENKQIKINKNNDRENLRRVPHKYYRGDYITLKKPGILRKLAIPCEGPYKVMRHNNNGSILIEKAPTNIKMLMYEELLHTIARVNSYQKQKLDDNDLLFEILI